MLSILTRFAMVVLAVAFPAPAMAQGIGTDVEESKISGDPKAPRDWSPQVLAREVLRWIRSPMSRRVKPDDVRGGTAAM